MFAEIIIMDANWLRAVISLVCTNTDARKKHIMGYQLIEAEWQVYASLNQAIIGSDNAEQTTTHWLNQFWIIVIWTLGTNFNEIWSKMQQFSLKICILEMSFAKWRPFCLGLNLLR